MVKQQNRQFITEDQVEVIRQKVLRCNSDEFDQLALEVFHFQAKNCAVYREYLNHLKLHPQNIQRVLDIPFMPISFFKQHKVISAELAEGAKCFLSSGTGDGERSAHWVNDIGWYDQISRTTFELSYGSLGDYEILALLPSYLEQGDSSLVHMVQHLMDCTMQGESCFFLHNHDALRSRLIENKNRGKKTILFGVTYALLNFIEQYAVEFPDLIIIETGGMKGRQKEITRAELHHMLRKGFNNACIHSEYGMTELLSQGYKKEDTTFKTPPWFKVFVRPLTQPFNVSQNGRGVVLLADLANIESCSFIESADLGDVRPDGFEILGRVDHAEIRGCNLMVQ